MLFRSWRSEVNADQRLRRSIAERLRDFEARPIALAAARRAAVAVPVVEEGPGADLPGMPELEAELAKLKIDIVIDHFAKIQSADGLEAPPFKALMRLLGLDPW